MILKIDENGEIIGYMEFSNADLENRFIDNNIGWFRSNFVFEYSKSYYLYKNNSFELKENWEELKDEDEKEIVLVSPTLDELKEEKIKNLNNKTDVLYREYLAKYPLIEIESFKSKANETALVIADNNVALTSTPYLSKLTNNDIEARNNLAFAVNAKMQKTAQMEAYAVLKRDEIKACTTIEELNSIELGE